MSDNYINNLKQTNMRPGKIKIEEKKETVLLEQSNNKHKKIHEIIIKWFMDNPYPNDEQVHKFSEELNLDPHEFEKHIYMVLSQILCEGRSKNFDGPYDAEQLKMGIKVEMEHTTNKMISEKIAKDHLAEISDYYTRLAKMEKSAGVEH
jgi:hypothetical protein